MREVTRLNQMEVAKEIERGVGCASTGTHPLCHRVGV